MWSFWSSSPEHAPLRFRPSRMMAGIRLLAFASITFLTAVPFAFAQKSNKPIVEERELITKDDLKLKITYFKSMAGADAPVVVMLHGKRGTRQQWKSLATDLQQKGDFAVITVDLRGHGESQLPKKAELKKSDYQSMVAFDMEAVKDFLLEEHTKKNLNVNKLGIVACEFSAAVAILYTEFDWDKPPYDDSPTEIDKTPRGRDVQALALISPETITPGLLANKAIIGLRVLGIPVMIGVAEKNSHDVATANKMFDQLTSKKDKDKEDHLYLEKYEGELRGMDLVEKNAKVRGHIFAFLTKHVKEHQSEWRDRRSRLDRD